MAELETYIKEARDQGLSDDHIRNALKAEGWNTQDIDKALSGLVVPKPPKSTTDTHHSNNVQSTGPLHSALHHVLLWFFLISASLSIGAAVSSLYGSFVSTTALASLMAVTLVTFTPYLIFFILFLGQTHRNPRLIPGRVWSIITICLASIGAMAAAITLVVTLVVSGDISVTISSLLLIALFAITLVTYSLATFASDKARTTRKVILILTLPAFALLMGTLFILSLLQLGPARHDEAVRDNLVTTVNNIRSHVDRTNTLPAVSEAETLIADDSSISYKALSSTAYELCAEFKTDTLESSSYSRNYTDTLPLTDTYVYESNFYADSGTQCFTVESDQLSIEQKP